MGLTEWHYESEIAKFRTAAAGVSDQTACSDLRRQYLSKKHGMVGMLQTSLRDVPRELKPKLGKEFNLFKKEVEKTLDELEKGVSKGSKSGKQLDLSMPGIVPDSGSYHPLTLTMQRMVGFFVNMGYDVAEGPEIETAYYNFEALNTPEDHPARDDADTFYLGDDRMLRTQTSGVQVRYMETHEPPFRMVAPGKVYRRDDDITHSPMFHQLEGLVVGENITMGDLKGTLDAFAKHMWGPATEVRLRPSYFPFTEPSAEMDVTCPFCGDDPAQCRVCKGTRWIEALGCGMVDPNVFSMVGYDPEKVTGFAFGMGIERVAMLTYNVPDIRYFYQNDRRFLDQFKIG